MDQCIVLIFTFVISVKLNAMTYVPIRQVSRFKKISCSDPNVAPIHRLDPFIVKSEPSSFHCAFLCDRNVRCSYAIFQDVHKHCKLLSSDEDFTPSSSYNKTSSCAVLKKLTEVQHGTSPQCSAVGTWKRTTSKDILAAEDADNLQMKLYEPSSTSTYINYVRSVSVDSNGYVVTGHGYLLIDQTKGVYKLDPILFPFKAFAEKGADMFAVRLKDDGNHVSPAQKSTKPLNYLLMRQTVDEPGGQASTIHVYTTGDIMKALSMGYRRIERSPTRIEIEKNGDVHFDMMDTYVVNSTSQMVSPIYLTSVKESLKSGMRYELRHQPFKDASLPDEVKYASKTWKMDTCWTKLQPRNGSETMLDVLMKAVTDGREIRILLANATISTDVVSIYSYKRTIRFTFPPYLIPFKGADILGRTKYIRHSVLGSSGILVGCEMTLNATTQREYGTVYNSIEYYASSRKWTQVMRQNGIEVTFGSHKNLYNAVMNGTNIRLCFTRFKSPSSFCYAPVQTVIVSEDNIIFQSPTNLRVVKDSEDGKLKSLYSGCTMIYKMVSSKGWVKVFMMKPGDTKLKEPTWSISDLRFFREL